jgi:hypothetical protein
MTGLDSSRRAAQISTKCLDTITAGDDIAAARQAEARALTLAAPCERYLAVGASHKNPP